MTIVKTLVSRRPPGIFGGLIGRCVANFEDKILDRFIVGCVKSGEEKKNEREMRWACGVRRESESCSPKQPAKYF